MDFSSIVNAVSFFKDHGGEIWNAIQNIFAALGVLYLSLLGLVKVTPTKKDDAFLEGISAFVNKMAGPLHHFAGIFGVKK